jgi:UDP-N-acetylmuramyl pentapeptide phosphotransferase/UDP-N-acetylglucosamine-1-phosphate transferase
MSSEVIYFISLVLVSIIFELLFFRIARKVEIIDRPNQRSSHQVPTIRGGGVIFFIAVLIWFLTNNFKWPWLAFSVMAVALISFLDDINERPAFLRLAVHLVAILLVFYQIEIFDWPFILVAIAIIICTGALSGFNFMDGINGITGLYALVNLSTFYWFQIIIPFSDIMLILAMMASVCVFLFFNLRNRAICFAGDVGSVTLALIQIFLLLQLIVATGNFSWVIMFLVYGVDTVVTILYRLKRRENILRPHRSHLYQLLANEMGLSHKIVALIYALIQVALNILLVYSYQSAIPRLPVIGALTFFLFYIIARLIVNQKVTHKIKNSDNLDYD